VNRGLFSELHLTLLGQTRMYAAFRVIEHDCTVLGIILGYVSTLMLIGYPGSNMASNIVKG